MKQSKALGQERLRIHDCSSTCGGSCSCFRGLWCDWSVMGGSVRAAGWNEEHTRLGERSSCRESVGLPTRRADDERMRVWRHDPTPSKTAPHLTTLTTSRGCSRFPIESTRATGTAAGWPALNRSRPFRPFRPLCLAKAHSIQHHYVPPQPNPHRAHGDAARVAGRPPAGQLCLPRRG